MASTDTYLMPATLADALKLADEYGGNCRIIAGGTDVMPNRFQGNDTAPYLIDISRLNELRKLEKKDSSIVIGSLTTLEEVSNNAEILKYFPALAEAANSAATPVIRKSATLGGNLLCENRCIFYNQSEWWREAVGYCLKCNGDICIASGGNKRCFSKFVSDTAAALISMDAYAEIITHEGPSNLKLEDLYTGDGIQPRNIKAGTVIKAIHLPINNSSRTVFKKLRLRKSLDFTSLSTSVTLKSDSLLKIVLCGVDPGPVVLNKRADDNKDDIIATALKKSRIVDNDVFSRGYRREMIRVFLRRSFTELGILK